MTEREFKEKYLEKFREVLVFALENNFSDFYRKKYDNLGIKIRKINSLKDFQKIPYLTKDEILATPLSNRIFVPPEEIVRYNISSGTTRHNKPLIIPQNNAMKGAKNGVFDLYTKHGLNKLMVLMPPNLAVKKMNGSTVPMIYGDINKMSLSAKVAKELGIDGIVTTPSALYLFIGELQNIDFDFNLIKFISIGSEFTTIQKDAYFKNVFPKAFLRYRYGNSEVSTAIGYRCEYLVDEAPGIFHPHEDKMMLETAGKKVEGELIVTHLRKTAFPLIRYRTGDYVMMEKKKCTCGNDTVLEIKGRIDFDVAKVAGGIIHTQAIADALKGLDNIVNPWFEAVVTEEQKNGKILAKITLNLIQKNNSVSNGSKSEIAQCIQENLYLSANKTLANFIEEKLFAPLEINFLPEIPVNAKSRNIILDL
jgi:phenylacetate-CoA ligase